MRRKLATAAFGKMLAIFSVVSAICCLSPIADAQDLTIFENGNIDAVENGPRVPTFVPINQKYLVTYIMTYHYFSGGMPPGQIGLRSQDTGEMLGPWQAVGQMGQGGVPNAYWIVRPNVPIPPGTYRVLDSDRPTWSTNAGSGYAGIATIKGIPN
jgi:hypothetical protein